MMVTTVHLQPLSALLDRQYNNWLGYHGAGKDEENCADKRPKRAINWRWKVRENDATDIL